MLIDGKPAKFAGIVHKSDMYISSGLLVFSPALNAAVGVVGEMRKSTSLKIFENSSIIFLRARRAFP